MNNRQSPNEHISSEVDKPFDNESLLKKANMCMIIFLLGFLLATYIAYGHEQNLPLMLLMCLHVSQLILAGAFKFSYVVRLVAQKQLGLAVR